MTTVNQTIDTHAATHSENFHSFGKWKDRLCGLVEATLHNLSIIKQRI